jgi:hypothetical protein
MSLLRLLAIVVFFTASLLGQAEWPTPNWEKVETLGCRDSSKPVFTSVGSYRVRLVPVPAPPISKQSASDPSMNDRSCRAYLIDHSGEEKLLLRDWEISIYQGTGEDIFSDGNPSLILEGYSGGAHCCYTYKIVSLGAKPLVLSSIKNEAPFFFFKDKASGQYRIMTSDGAFDYFDGMCHACTPFPRVVLQANGAGLHDVSPQFVEQYDSEIAVARAKIADGDIGKFLAADFEDAKKVVLEIVLAYLYSGREEQAWQALDEMWPAGDRERIKKLILKTRAQGFLSKLAATAPRPLPAPSAR